MPARTMERTPRRSAAQRETTILLGDNGRHVLLGRNGEPDAAEVARIGAHLAKQCQGGWVVLMRGDYWNRRRPVDLVMVREAAPTSVPFTVAAEAFEARRLGEIPP